MKNSNQSDQIKVLEAKIDRLQRSITKLEKKLTDHIAFIDRVYEPLRNPISKIKNFFGAYKWTILDLAAITPIQIQQG